MLPVFFKLDFDAGGAEYMTGVEKSAADMRWITHASERKFRFEFVRQVQVTLHLQFFFIEERLGKAGSFTEALALQPGGGWQEEFNELPGDRRHVYHHVGKFANEDGQ